MPLEYVSSNAGRPMLVTDRYTFHKHSSNPKTGRTNWRCSRRRVKDIRCPSSCNTVNDIASVPSPHDPNCLPLTGSELMNLQSKREPMFHINNIKNENLLNNTTSPNDVTISHIFNDNFHNTDSFGNRNELDDDDLGNVINDYENTVDLENENVNNDIENNNISIVNNENNNNQESIDSMIKDYGLPPSNANSVQMKVEMSDFLNENKNLEFVTSKVGHPMLVMDGYRFHKHSTNHKTGRVNWRCSRRRVRDIRCPSSCYTEKGTASKPMPHHINCYPPNHEGLLDTSKRNNNDNPSNNQVNINGFIESENFDNTTDLDSFGYASQYYHNNDDQNGSFDELEEFFDGEFNDYTDNVHSDKNGESEPQMIGIENGIDNEHEAEQLNSSYLIDSYSPENTKSIEKLIVDLNKIKHRERNTRQELISVNNELVRVKKNSSAQIQTLRWKAKMVDIDAFSLKSSLQQKSTENLNLRKLVDEMMTKMNTK